MIAATVSLVLGATGVTTAAAAAPPSGQSVGSVTVVARIGGPAAGAQDDVRIRVSCSDGVTRPDFVVPAGTTGSASHSITGIPAGTTCTAGEIDDGLPADHSLTVGIGGDNNHMVAITAGGAAIVDITDTYRFVPGSLTVATLFGGVTGGDRGPVTIRLDCSGADEPYSADHTFPVGALGRDSITFSPIPAPSTCAVTETADGSTGTVHAHTANGTQHVQVGPGQRVTADEISNIYPFAPGSLTVSETIAGPGAALRGRIVIGVECDGESLPNFVIEPGAPTDRAPSRTYQEIPAGSRCTASEIDAGADASVTVQITGDNNHTVRIGPDAQAALHLTGTYRPTPGSLTVPALFTGPAAGSQGPVTIEVACTGGAKPFSASHTFPQGTTNQDSATFGSIPGGSSCVITEPHTGAITGSVTVGSDGVPQTVPVPPGRDVRAHGITNSYGFASGSLTLTTTIAGAQAGQQGGIQLQVACNGTPLDPNPLVIPAGATGSTTHTFPGIPAGSRCTVEEVADGSTNGVSVLPEFTNGDGNVTIEPGTDSAVGITATVQSAPPLSLRVLKQIVGPAAGSQGKVTIHVACATPNGPVTGDSSVSARSAAGFYENVFQRIPVGSECTITETDDGSVAGSVTVTTTGLPQTLTILPDHGAQARPIVNRYDYVPGQLTVRKTITGPAAGQQGEVRMQTVCDGQALPDFVIPAGATGTHSHTYTDVPGNAVCTASEIADGATSTVTATTTDDSDTTVTVPPGGTVTVDLSDTYHPVPGALVVDALVAGPAADQHGPITLGVACTMDGDPSFSHSITIAAGVTEPQRQRFNGVPSGSSCAVTETTDGHTDTVTADVTITPDAPIDITPGDAAVITVLDRYEFAPGQLTVSKAVTGSAAGQQGAVRIQAVCDGRVLPDFVIPAGATGTRSRTFADVPGNATCTASELADGAADATTVTIGGDNGKSVTVPAGGSASVGLTDTYDQVAGELVVRALLGGRALGSQGRATLAVACTQDGGPSYTGTLAIPAGTTTAAVEHTFGDIPPGSTCSVSETASGATDTVIATFYTGRSQTIQVPAAGPTRLVERALLFDHVRTATPSAPTEPTGPTEPTVPTVPSAPTVTTLPDTGVPAILQMQFALALIAGGAALLLSGRRRTARHR